MEIETALERIKSAVGPRGWLDDPAEQEPYLTEARRLWRGATRLVVRPASLPRSRQWCGSAPRRGCRSCRKAQYRSRRRRRPAGGRRQHRSRPRPHEPHSRDRSRQFHNDRRGGLHSRATARSRRRDRPAVPAQPRRRGQLPDRRQSVDQCGRHCGIGLWQYARADLGARSRAPRRAGLGRAEGAAQGQYRLRSEAALHRRRGHTRRHHRGDRQAVSKATRDRDGVFSA